MGARRRGRVLAFQSLYSYEVNGCSLENLLSFSWIDPERLEKLKKESLDFARLIATGTIENLASIDDQINSRVEHWDFSRINRVDLSILRISVYALLFQHEIPSTVTIDEAIDIAKEYGTDESYRFVNGVLDGISKHH
ncbi:hypothetical protein LCGC14_2884010 [marine sediment metagenome]|uniref:NusB/RsmB/TIM44 domain-containing protein n=1 Tax=marine sediment metagenome TaxID=412755 RepID=A0A0F9A793_9ZZZZ